MSKSTPVIVVLGMHRSGTSVVCRSMSCLGAQFGSNLIPKNFDNEKGFWEDRDIVRLNNNLLTALNLHWYGSVAPVEIEWANPQVQALRKQASDLLLEKVGQKDTVFCFKDPRTSGLLEFWKVVFRDADLEPRFVVSFRNPVEVADSLESRNALSRTKSYYLWLASVRSALHGTNGYKRTLVSFSSLLEEPSANIERMAQDLSLPVDHQELEEEFVGKFIDSSLKHFSADQARLDALQFEFPLVVEAYKILNELPCRPGVLEEIETGEMLENFATASAGSDVLLESWQVEESNLISAIALSNELRAEVDSFRSRLAASNGDHSRTVEELAVKLSETEAELDSFIRERDSLLEKYRFANEELARDLLGKATLPDGSRVWHSADCEESDRDDALPGSHLASVYQSQIEVLSERLEAIEQSLSWKVTAPVRSLITMLVKFAATCGALTAKPATFVWSKLPLSANAKDSFKSLVFGSFPKVLHGLSIYKDWVAYEQSRSVSASRLLDLSEHPFKEELSAREFEQALPGSIFGGASARLVAFYLPQFHPIAENDVWWGEGFTEWSNVRPALPQYEGHDQPRTPGELGYYDILDDGVMHRQIELAKSAGLEGFCFYFYWFAGKRLLEAPLERYLGDTSLDFPFCLCWANENWSRSWDGLENEILIAQKHSETDDINFIEYVSKYLLDERYIKVDGKPVLLVYRPSLLPDPFATATRWRDWCRENDVGEIYLVSTTSFDSCDPGIFGFDAATEFPPNNTSPESAQELAPRLQADFSGNIFDWRSIAARSADYLEPDYKLFRGVNPRWDNTARRDSASTIFVGSTPHAYQAWMERAILDTKRRFLDPSEQLIFINAWNEWAEGAYLEPDQSYGYAYLNATRQALEKVAATTQASRRILLVAHDAHPHGAQYLILQLAKCLREGFGFEVAMISLGPGPLLSQYAEYADLHDLSALDPTDDSVGDILGSLWRRGFREALCNTVVSGPIAGPLKDAGFRVVTLIHELPNVITDNQLEAHAAQAATHSDAMVFPAQLVAAGFSTFAEVEEEKIVIRPQGLLKRNSAQDSASIQAARIELRRRFGLPESQRVVLCVGYADLRKGVDLFVDCARHLCSNRDDVTFIWVGHFDVSLEPKIRALLLEHNLFSQVLFVGMDFESDVYFAGADVYALTSREDPFPSVVLQSLEVGVPVVAFREAGGFENLLSQGCGLLADFDDTKGFADAINDLLVNCAKREALGLKGQSLVMSDFSFRRYIFDLLDLLGLGLKRVSVVVPNYNYADYIAERIKSIHSQSYPIYELIILDDASDDESLDVIGRELKNCSIDTHVVVNETNSGSPFRQWLKGLQTCTGDYVWIAEADDLSLPDFLSDVLLGFGDEGVVLSYCQSAQIDASGAILADDYLYYSNDVSDTKWSRSHVSSGIDEVQDCLAVKNTIPNVSGTVIKRSHAIDAFQANEAEILELRFAGDWRFYVHLVEHGKIAYCANSHNLHRRHASGVTLSSMDRNHLIEVLRMQRYVRENFSVSQEIQKIARIYAMQLLEQFQIETRAGQEHSDEELLSLM